MNHDFVYQLDKGSKKFFCPKCKKRRFVRYQDIKTMEYLPEHYGRCDREISCGYHLNPFNDGYGVQEPIFREQILPEPKPKSPRTFIPLEILKATMKDWDGNIFIQNLLYRIPFPVDKADLEKVISMYYLGTVSKGDHTGSVTFPFIDREFHVRAIQVKLFSNANHTMHTTFIHAILEKHYLKRDQPIPRWLMDYKKTKNEWGIVTCLFGEHLLDDYQLNPVALVEAPKTAVLGTLYFGFPGNANNLLWLAVYNLSSLTEQKCQALKGRRVYLFPDLSKDGKAYNLWSQRAKELESTIPGTRFKVSDFLERIAGDNDRDRGLDIADFLTSVDWRKFRFGEKGENSEALKTIYFFGDDEPKFGNEYTKKTQDKEFSKAEKKAVVSLAVKEEESSDSRNVFHTFGDFVDYLKTTGKDKAYLENLNRFYKMMPK